MEKYLEELKRQGADQVLIISPESVVAEAWVGMKCRYGCGRYNKSLCCPPHTPDWRETREILSCYRRAILFSTAKMEGGTAMAVECSRQLMRDGYYKSFAYGIGPCTICGECALAEGVCRKPHDSAPSMEACGIDVIATVRAQGIDMHMPPLPGEPLRCWGMVMVD